MLYGGKTMDFRVTDVVTEQDRKEVYEGLLEYNLSKIEDKNPRELGVYLEDESGKKIAGLIGDTRQLADGEVSLG